MITWFSMSRYRFLSLLLMVVGAMTTVGLQPSSVQACAFDLGERWCGNCGYTCIKSDQTCPGASQCGDAGSTDLRTIEPDRTTGGGQGVVPDGSGGYVEAPASQPGGATADAGGPSPLTEAEKQAAGNCGTESFCGGTSSAYRCVPISTTGGCNIRCAMTTDPACVAGTGLPAGVRIEGHAYTYFCNGCQACTTNACNTQTEMTIPCVDGVGNIFSNGEHVCIPFDAVRQAERSGVTKALADTYSNAARQLIENVFLGGQRAFTQVVDDDGQTLAQWYLQGSLGGVFDDGTITTGRTINYDPNGSNTCTPGQFQTVMLEGKPMTTQLGGDRGACGEPGGCPAGQQRGCTADGKLTDQCVPSDACAWQVQPLQAGQSCAGLRRMSDGEPSKGYFVGCLADQNCFCQTLTASSTIQCYNDAGLDSCAAAGRTTTQTATTTTATTTTATPTPPPASTPTPPPAATPTPPPITPQCEAINVSQAPKYGDQVHFLCSGTPRELVNRYEFRYAWTPLKSDRQSPDQLQFKSLSAQQGKPAHSQPITIDKVGRYIAQCRPCTAQTCGAWEPISASFIDEGSSSQ